MARIVKWLVFGPAALVIIVLSVSNRRTVTFSLAPMPFEVDLPLYLLLLAAVLIGVVLGGIACALSRWARAQRKAIQNRAGNAVPSQKSAADTTKVEPV